MYKILIVEDEQAIANLVKMNLSHAGYDCDLAYDGQQGADYIEKNKYDLVLLDIMLPKINGYELLEYMKQYGMPVIFMTAKTEIGDRIKGLKLGAEDYIVKPFQIGELLARVEVILRRYGKGSTTLQCKEVEVDLHSRIVRQDGKEIILTVKEFELLVELIQNKNVALYRSQLYEKVWGGEFVGDTRTLDSHIQRLRKKLGWEERIRTVFRIGYRLEG